MKGGTIQGSEGGSRLVEQEQGQDQDHRGSAAWHPPGHKDSEARRGSARVAWRLQWGLAACIGLPHPHLMDSAVGPRIPPNPILPYLPLPTFVPRVAVWVQEAKIQDTGFSQTGSRTGLPRAEILPFLNSATPGLSGTRSFGPGPHG